MLPRSFIFLASVPTLCSILSLPRVEIYTAPWVQCTQEFACLICSMRAAWTPPFICVSAKQLWHQQGMSSEAKIRSLEERHLSGEAPGVTGIPNMYVCVCVVCVCDEYLLWPLSSKVLTLNLPDSGTSAGFVHPHIQTPSLLCCKIVFLNFRHTREIRTLTRL